MNAIENVTSHGSIEEAEDLLAGMRELPGFLLGYVRLPRLKGEKHQVVVVFDCYEGSAPSAPGQREVTTLSLKTFATTGSDSVITCFPSTNIRGLAASISRA